MSERGWEQFQLDHRSLQRLPAMAVTDPSISDSHSPIHDDVSHTELSLTVSCIEHHYVRISPRRKQTTFRNSHGNAPLVVLDLEAIASLPMLQRRLLRSLCVS